MQVCPNCRAENADESAFCSACGYALTAAPVPPPPPPDYQPPTTPPHQASPAQPGYAASPPQYQNTPWVSYSGQPSAPGQSAPQGAPGQYAPQGAPGQFQQAYPGQRGQVAIGPPPKSNLGTAIFATVCCCMPAGVVALVYAAQVKSKWTMGDYAGAQQAAKTAQTWATVAIVLGLVWVVISVIVAILSPETATNLYSY